MTLATRLLAPALLALLAGLSPARAQMSASDLVVRLDRLENQIRQLTGAVEQLQFRNRELEQQMRRMQEDVEFRFQEQGKGGARPPPRAQAAPPVAPQAVQLAPAPPPPSAAAPPPGPPAQPQRRSDVFDPAQNPSAPGAPHTLGSITTGPAGAAPPPVISADEDEGPPVGVPGGRQAGAPLDLSTMSAQAASDPALAPPPPPGPQANASPLPPPPPRNPSGTGAQQQAMLPPTATPKDEYDLAYGYLLRKDYALAEESFRGFLTKHPSDRLVAEANYWLGESLFQRQRYRDAAESFLTVSTRYDKSAKAPEALLRLGQSLAGLKEKEQACATFAEVPRRYPRAPANVKQAAEREQKRAGC
jgi:tol-pal system protein YbgF